MPTRTRARRGALAALAAVVALGTAFVASVPPARAQAQAPAGAGGQPSPQQPATAPSTAAAAIPADQSTPRSALRVLADAMEAGDANRIRGVLHAANATENRMVEAMIDLATATAELRSASVAAFGAQGAQPLTGDTAGMAAAGLERLAGATETLDPTGDRATIGIGGGAEPPAVVVKVDGKWKYPVGELAKGSTDADVKQGIEDAATQAKLLRDFAGEVKQGKYKTAEEVLQAMDQRVMQMVAEQRGAATQPGGAGGAATRPARQEP